MRTPSRSVSTSGSPDKQGGNLNARSSNGRGSPPSHDSEKKATKKPVNFDISSIEIGQWKQVAQREGALLGRCFFPKKLLVWEFLPISDQKKVRMVIKWTKIIAAKTSNLNNDRVLLEIELNEKPTFDEEKSVNSKHSSFQTSHDFTDGNASRYRRHRVELAHYIFSRNFIKLMEDEDTPFGKLLEKPFQYHPSSMFEIAPSLNMIHETGPQFNFPLSHLEQTEATGSWTNVPIVPQIEPTANVLTSNVVHKGPPCFDPIPFPQETAVSDTWTQEPVWSQQLRPEPPTTISPPNVVHENTPQFDLPFYTQQTEASSSWTKGPVLPQQVEPDPLAFNATHNIDHETTTGFDLPFYTQQTEASSSWTQGPVLPQQVKPHETITRFDLPFYTQQTEASSTWTQGPVLPQQVKPGPTTISATPNVVHETAPWFNLPSHPQQTERSGSWTQGTSVPLQQCRYQTLPGLIPTFQPELDYLPFNKNSFSLGFEDPRHVENNAPYSSSMTHQDPSGSNYNFPMMFTGIDSVEPDPYGATNWVGQI